MITSGDVQYEPAKVKVAQVTPTCLTLVAGDLGYHSKAIKDLFKQVNYNSTTSPETIAQIYGQAIQAIKRKEAEDLYLAPLGLNTDTFIAQQKEMSDSFVATLREQLQNHRGAETEAIIVGPEIVREHHVMRIFEVDTHGLVTCHDDVAFAAVGSGSWHARSRLMQYGYVNTITLAPALAAAYAGKKAAEVAPGVGKETDIMLVLRDHTEHLRTELAEELPRIYQRYEAQHIDLVKTVINDLDRFLGEVAARDQEAARRARENSQTDADSSQAAAEASRPDENGPTSDGGSD